MLGLDRYLTKEMKEEGGISEVVLELSVAEFFEHVEAGDLFQVTRYVLSRNVELEAENLTGETGLIVACRLGHTDLVEFFCSKGADLMAEDLECWSGLLNAARNGFEVIVRKLISCGADIEQGDSVGVFYLMDPISYPEIPNPDAKVPSRPGPDPDSAGNRSPVPIPIPTLSPGPEGVIRSDTLWDRLVFRKVREGMGGRVQLIVCGSAPLAENVLTFMRAALGCIVIEGYGQTECVAAASATLEGDHEPGQVGPPIPCCMMRLVDVPDMNYFTKDNKGELCIKGPNVSQGYFEDPLRTAETFDPDGWLHTGDIAKWTADGTVKIIDRKKHIFKLAQGEYIAPEKIENVYVSSRYVAQVFVHGESLKSCIVAVVVPDPDVLPKEVEKQLRLTGFTLDELCQNATVKKMILDDMTKVGKDSKLHSFEQVKDIHLHPDLFSVENGLLTPTFKSKRPQLLEKFADNISRMYSSLI